MHIVPISQPFTEETSAGDILQRWAADPAITRIDIAVAWAKRSGVRLISEALSAFRARGGRLRIIVGISAGGATRQGLEAVHALADAAFVFHHSARRTFHPKLYIASGPEVGRILVGSQNMTPGGLQTNFEVGCLVEIDRTEPADEAALQSFQAIFERYRTYEGACLPLTPETIHTLSTQPRYQVGDEAKRSAPGPAPDGPPSIFAPNKKNLRGARRKAQKPPAKKAAPAVRYRWYKTLSAADAQHPRSTRTNPTGHLTLVKAGHPIESGSWFRETFFGAAGWTQTSGRRVKEHREITFAVTVPGQQTRTHTLKISHTPSFEADQGNRTTVLHWGTLIEVLKAHDLTGSVVTLERVSDRFSLTIADRATGGFLG